jgi:hypothetical protein
LCKKLELAQKRIEELEAKQQSAQHCIAEARTKLKESEETSRADRSRLEAAEKKMCELEMRARTAEGQAKDNSNTLARIEEAISHSNPLETTADKQINMITTNLGGGADRSGAPAGGVKHSSGVSIRTPLVPSATKQCFYNEASCDRANLTDELILALSRSCSVSAI